MGLSNMGSAANIPTRAQAYEALRPGIEAPANALSKADASKACDFLFEAGLIGPKVRVPKFNASNATDGQIIKFQNNKGFVIDAPEFNNEDGTVSMEAYNSYTDTTLFASGNSLNEVLQGLVYSYRTNLRTNR